MKFIIQDIKRNALFGSLDWNKIDLISDSEITLPKIKLLFDEEIYIAENMELCSLSNGESVLVCIGVLKDNVLEEIASLAQINDARPFTPELYYSLRVYTLSLKLAIWRGLFVEEGQDSVVQLFDSIIGVASKNFTDPIDLDFKDEYSAKVVTERKK